MLFRIIGSYLNTMGVEGVSKPQVRTVMSIPRFVSKILGLLSDILVWNTGVSPVGLPNSSKRSTFDVRQNKT